MNTNPEDEAFRRAMDLRYREDYLRKAQVEISAELRQMHAEKQMAEKQAALDAHLAKGRRKPLKGQRKEARRKRAKAAKQARKRNRTSR